MTASPLLSIGIPAYRGAAHLAAAIDSVLSQDFGDYELIVIDDNSPDETASIVAGYRDPRVSYLRNEVNLGPQGNWNRCLTEARGRYFKLMPQDDVLQPGCLARQVAVLEGDVESHIALVFCSRLIIDAKGRTVMRRGYARAREGVIPADSVIRRCVRSGTNLIGEPGAVMFRRETALRIGPFDATNPYVIDLDYWFRLLATGDAYYLHEPLAAFRISSGSWSVAIGARQTADFRRFIARIRQSVHGIGKLDRLRGYCMAAINTRLRALFYRFMLERTAS